MAALAARSSATGARTRTPSRESRCRWAGVMVSWLGCTPRGQPGARAVTARVPVNAVTAPRASLSDRGAPDPSTRSPARDVMGTPACDGRHGRVFMAELLGTALFVLGAL